MQKILDLIKKNKKLVALISGGIIILIIGVIVSINILFASNEKKLTKELEIMGASFYEDYYYDALKNNYKDKEDEFVSFLSGFKDNGLKVNLDNATRVGNNKDKLSMFVNSKTKEECDAKNTMIIIYPKENYGKKDYRIEVKLVCGFDKK